LFKFPYCSGYITCDVNGPFPIKIYRLVSLNTL
jgi:hypothetical protein